MIPESYKPAEGKGMEHTDTSMILAAINRLSVDFEKDLKEFGGKLDSVIQSHNDLRVSVARETATMAAKIEQLDNNTSELWDEIRAVQQDHTSIRTSLTQHCAEGAGASKKSDTLGTIARWSITTIIAIGTFAMGRLFQ
jgi:hypothetical protein